MSAVASPHAYEHTFPDTPVQSFLGTLHQVLGGGRYLEDSIPPTVPGIFPEVFLDALPHSV